MARSRRYSRHQQPPAAARAPPTPTNTAFRKGTRSRTGTRSRRPSRSWAALWTPTRWASGSTTGSPTAKGRRRRRPLATADPAGPMTEPCLPVLSFHIRDDSNVSSNEVVPDRQVLLASPPLPTQLVLAQMQQYPDPAVISVRQGCHHGRELDAELGGRMECGSGLPPPLYTLITSFCLTPVLFIGIVYEYIADGTNHDSVVRNMADSLHLAGFNYDGTPLKRNWRSGMLVDHSDIVRLVGSRKSCGLRDTAGPQHPGPAQLCLLRIRDLVGGTFRPNPGNHLHRRSTTFRLHRH